MLMLRNRFSPEVFDGLRRDMDRLFGALATGNGNVAPGRGFPALNLWEEDGGYVIEAELPGIALENLDIEIAGNELTLKGQRKFDYPENARFLRREHGETEFTRTITLPVEVNGSKADATMKDGVLRISLPKAEAAKARKISVKNG